MTQSTLTSPVIASEGKRIKIPMAGLDYGEPFDELETLLGSCVGIALWDRRTKKGSLAHIVLSDSRGEQSLPGKFADTAIETMRQELISRGAYAQTMVAKLTGGATMFGPKTNRDIGGKNCRAAKDILGQYGIRVIAEHIGGDQGRVICVRMRDFSIEVSIKREVVATI